MAYKQFRKHCPKSPDQQHDLIDATPVGNTFEKLMCTFCKVRVTTGKFHKRYNYAKENDHAKS